MKKHNFSGTDNGQNANEELVHQLLAEPDDARNETLYLLRDIPRDLATALLCSMEPHVHEKTKADFALIVFERILRGNHDEGHSKQLFDMFKRTVSCISQNNAKDKLISNIRLILEINFCLYALPTPSPARWYDNQCIRLVNETFGSSLPLFKYDDSSEAPSHAPCIQLGEGNFSSTPLEAPPRPAGKKSSRRPPDFNKS